jgi:hypothetical protein
MLSITSPLSDRLIYCAELVKTDELIEAVADAEAFHGFLDNNDFKDADEAQIAIDEAGEIQSVLEDNYIDGHDELKEAFAASRKLRKLADDYVNLRYCVTAHEDDIKAALAALESFLNGE